MNDWIVTAQKRLDSGYLVVQAKSQVSHCGSKKSDNRLIPQSPANPTLGREFAKRLVGTGALTGGKCCPSGGR